MAPHSLTMTMIGASLLWVGWFGFNVGSNLEANGVATLVFVNTFLATCRRDGRLDASPNGWSRASPRCSARRRARLPVWWPSRRPAATWA